ncbi:MAG: class I SAM-dependent methyltransferase [Candidatus Gracilibacteria bacterium]|nr:class I SAM-dependent methyltransferase [Candidatus Gracilibacteria bacterium]
MTNIENFLKELKAYGVANDIPNVTETNARFLRDLVKIKGAKNLLEVGMANGYSTINFAIEIQKNGGKITTIEFSPDSVAKAKANFEAVKLDGIIDIRCGNALDILPSLGEKYDFIFIDAMKKRYKDFFILTWDKLESGGIMILDDVIKFRHKMESFYEYMEEIGLEYNLLPIDEDDGVIMIVKD